MKIGLVAVGRADGSVTVMAWVNWIVELASGEALAARIAAWSSASVEAVKVAADAAWGARMAAPRARAETPAHSEGLRPVRDGLGTLLR